MPPLLGALGGDSVQKKQTKELAPPSLELDCFAVKRFLLVHRQKGDSMPKPPSVQSPPRPNPTNLLKAPYRKKAAVWAEAQDQALKQSGVGRAGREALRCWAIQETRAGKSLDFTPHQLAKLGGCNVRTIYRDIPLLQKASLIESVAPGNRGARKASLFRLSLAMPEWGGFTTSRTPERDRQATFHPSPGDLRSLNESPTYPPTDVPADTTHEVHPQLHECAPGVEGEFTKKTVLQGPEKALAEDLLQAGCGLPGVLAAVKSASEGSRVQEARTDVRTVLAYLQLHPGWVKNPAGLLIRSVQDPARARTIRRQFRYQQLKVRRAQNLASKTARAGAEFTPEPLRIDIQELLEDSREAFQDLPREVQIKIQACVATDPTSNADRTFIEAVGKAIQSARRGYS